VGRDVDPSLRGQQQYAEDDQQNSVKASELHASKVLFEAMKTIQKKLYALLKQRKFSLRQ
jgi:hypothetical protein